MRYAYDENDLYLAHHGIKGQKWGVRRFQYDNGSYTPEGKERYRGSESEKENVYDGPDDSVKVMQQFDKAHSKLLSMSPQEFRKLNGAYREAQEQITKTYLKAYKESPEMKQIAKEQDEVVKEYYQSEQLTRLTIGDLLFHKKESEEKRDRELTRIKAKYQDLRDRQEQEEYRIMLNILQKWPDKGASLFAMGIFKPYEKPWSDVRIVNKLSTTSNDQRNWAVLQQMMREQQEQMQRQQQQMTEQIVMDQQRQMQEQMHQQPIINNQHLMFHF